MSKPLLSPLIVAAPLTLSVGLSWAETAPSSKPSSRAEVDANSGNGFYYPANRWSYQHMEELYPTASLDRGENAASPCHWH